MICTACKKAEAVVFIKHIVNNQVSQASLCAECAAKAHVPISPAGSLGALLQLLAKSGGPRPKVLPAARCPGCGATWEDFRATGRFGCARCYGQFAAQIRPLIPRVHAGAYAHRGKSPQPPRSGG